MGERGTVPVDATRISLTLMDAERPAFAYCSYKKV